MDSITVGYQAAQTGGYSPPTNLLINGQAVTIDQTPITTTTSPTTSTSGCSGHR
ncbi:1,4-beta-glucanase [Mycobacterium tuberculosis]